LKQDDQLDCICFHCSQQLDNFHNFARKINQIQKVLYPEENEIQEPTFAYEITIIPSSKDDYNNDEEQPAYKVTTIKTRSQPLMTIEEQDTSFNSLKESQIVLSKADNEHPGESIKLIEIAKSDDECDDKIDEDNILQEVKIPKKLIRDGQLIYKGKKLMKLMSMFYSTTCEECNSTFQSINDLFEHQKTQHSNDSYVNCCSTKLTKLPRLIWHFVKHIQPEAFKCPTCDYTVSRPKFLEFHMQTHSDKKPFSCDHCDKQFIWKGALKSHLFNNHLQNSEKKSYMCVICFRQYATPGSLASHKKSVHFQNVDRSRNLCEICSKSFATYTSYKEHMISHSEDYDKLQLKCPECGKWLKNQRCLKSHLKTHSGVDYKCSSCDYTTKKENLLKNHIVTKHTSDRPFKCDQCDKTFKVKRHLTVHTTQAHLGQKEAKTCEFCDRKFNSSSNYYTHRKTIHAHELSEVNEKKQKENQLKRIKIGLEG
jgi:uncharacterized C2H2 Zn-finger protein